MNLEIVLALWVIIRSSFYQSGIQLKYLSPQNLERIRRQLTNLPKNVKLKYLSCVVGNWFHIQIFPRCYPADVSGEANEFNDTNNDADNEGLMMSHTRWWPALLNSWHSTWSSLINDPGCWSWDWVTYSCSLCRQVQQLMQNRLASKGLQ